MQMRPCTSSRAGTRPAVLPFSCHVLRRSGVVLFQHAQSHPAARTHRIRLLEEPRANAWIAEPLRAACKHVPRLPDTDPDAPGPFAFANDARVKGILTEAGFSSIAMERCDLSLDVALGRGLEFAVKGMFEIGPVSRALQGQPDEALSAVAKSIRAVLAPREKDGSILLDASVWIVTAANPG